MPKNSAIALRSFYPFFLFAMAALLSPTLPTRAQTTGPRVPLQSGIVEGNHVSWSARGAEFLGIPYAAQPVGNLRWKTPQPAPAWRGVRKATAWAPACMQTPSGWLPEMLGKRQMATSEACLYLNVWTPDIQPRALLPVIVWVHGGGNVEGSGEWPPLGRSLAEKGIVVVSFNYRLGAFGFFSSPQLSAESSHRVSGNYGQLDQLQALRWVHENIRLFGGDPKRVTIAGQSSGALDICNLMASPLARGLFQGAILQSGVCVDSIYPTLQTAASNGALLEKDLGIPDGPGSLNQLRRIPAQKILLAAANDPRLDLEPVIDGWIFPNQPARIFAEKKLMPIPVLVGSNEDEVTIFASPLVTGKAYRPKTVVEYKSWLQREFRGDAGAVFALYPASSDAEVLRTFDTMYSDYDFAFGAYLMAREVAAIHQPVYLYRFRYAGIGKFASLGAFHSEESMFLSRKYWTSWTPRPYDKTLSDAIRTYWAAFASAGNPNNPVEPAWPAFHTSTEQCQELGSRIGPETVPRQTSFILFQRYLDERLRPDK